MEETQRQIYLAAIAELERLGFHQYEISNFARPGFESRHNLRYWRCEEYLGIGPAAASCLGGRRFVFPRDIDAFLAAENPWSLCEDEGEADRLALELKELNDQRKDMTQQTAPPWKRPVRGMTPERCSSGPAVRNCGSSAPSPDAPSPSPPRAFWWRDRSFPSCSGDNDLLFGCPHGQLSDIAAG